MSTVSDLPKCRLTSGIWYSRRGMGSLSRTLDRGDSDGLSGESDFVDVVPAATASHSVARQLVDQSECTIKMNRPCITEIGVDLMGLSRHAA